MADYLRLIDTRGVGRYDVTPLFADAAAFAALLDDLALPFAGVAVDLIAGIDALGFILAVALATRLGKGFVPLRKGGKLPVPADATSFVDYSGTAKSLELRRGAIPAGAHVLLVDEWVETGTQLGAAIELLERQGGQIAGIATIAMDDNAATQALRAHYRCHATWLLAPDDDAPPIDDAHTADGADDTDDIDDTDDTDDTCDTHRTTNRSETMTTATTAELIATLAAIPDQLEALARQATQAGGTTPPNGAPEDTWTPSEIAGHLCDAARYWGARMRRVVHEQSPALDRFDEGTMVRLAAYRYWPLDMLLRSFRLLSEDTVAFLRGLPPEAWDRSGIHEEYGLLTLREIVEIEAGHERTHVQQFAAALGVQEP
jgi:adenine phosphoribosyltransferase